MHPRRAGGLRLTACVPGVYISEQSLYCRTRRPDARDPEETRLVCAHGRADPDPRPDPSGRAGAGRAPGGRDRPQRRVPAGHVRPAARTRSVHAALPAGVRRHEQHGRGLPRDRGVRPRLLQHRLLAAAAVGALRRDPRGRHARAEAALPRRPRIGRAARRDLHHRAAERLGRGGHHHPRHPGRGRVQPDRRQGLVHQLAGRRFRARGRQDRALGGRRLGRQHQPVHRRARRPGLHRRAQGGQDGRARRAVVRAFPRSGLRAAGQHPRRAGPRLQGGDGGVQPEPPADRRARRGPRPGRDRPRARLCAGPLGLRQPDRRLPGGALDAGRHGDPDRGRPQPRAQGRGDGRCGRGRRRGHRWPSASRPTPR